MERVPEPELMEDEAQARAYAEADFEEPNALFMQLWEEGLAGAEPMRIVDLGCGPADIVVRLARRHPVARIEAIDGSAAMLRHGIERVRREGLDERVHLVQARLPGAGLAPQAYDAVVSNSLLHHLHDPAVLWRTVRACARIGAAVLVMDLARPASDAEARALVERHASGEPGILRRDFYNSLLAAWRPEEVRAQLIAAGLDGLEVRLVSDRHLAVQGRIRAKGGTGTPRAR